jgi:hypothetical protein
VNVRVVKEVWVGVMRLQQVESESQKVELPSKNERTEENALPKQYRT